MTTSAQQDGAPTGKAEDFIEDPITFPDGSQFQRLKPITDFRKDPGEARMLYTVKRLSGSLSAAERGVEGQELVLKVKAQWPGPQNLILEGPSPYTTAELEALQLFTDRHIAHVPHLVCWKKTTQSHHGCHPGGYAIYTIMTKMPGVTLWDLPYWSLPDSQRDEIKAIFLEKLREIRGLGIAPYDCALRNILWDAATKTLSIVDFEHYEASAKPIEDETFECQRWGVVRRPPPRTWFQEWGLKGI